jgi:hypothetical protein
MVSSLGQQVHTVMVAHYGGGVWPQGVEDSDRVRFRCKMLYVGMVGPAEGGYLVVGG